MLAPANAMDKKKEIIETERRVVASKSVRKKIEKVFFLFLQGR